MKTNVLRHSGLIDNIIFSLQLINWSINLECYVTEGLKGFPETNNFICKLQRKWSVVNTFPDYWHWGFPFSDCFLSATASLRSNKVMTAEFLLEGKDQYIWAPLQYSLLCRKEFSPVSKAADLNWLVQGGQLYWIFPFSEDSLVWRLVGLFLQVMPS